MNKHISRLLAVACIFALPTTVFAHPGHGVGSFFSGVTHPVTGWDHMVVMLAVGLWSASVMRNKVWVPVAVFTGSMLAGLALGLSGMAISNVELGITASIIFMGLLLLSSRQTATMLSTCVIGFFAMFHGYAHGVEMPHMASTWVFAAGMLITTLMLHLAGIGLGQLSVSLRMARLNQLLGAMLSGLGLWLLVGNI